MSDLERLLTQVPDGPMKDALREQEPHFAEDIALAYVASDDVTRQDMLAFFIAEGPRKIHEFRLRAEDGVPTSTDLEEWIQ